MSKAKQRVAIEFCVKLGKSPTETCNLLEQAYGDSVLKNTQVFKWHKRFRDGWAEEEIEESRGRPNTSTDNEHITNVSALIVEDPRMTVRRIADSWYFKIQRSSNSF